MKRLNADVGSADGPFEQAPIVLKPVGVNVAIYILYGVIHDLMRVLAFQSLIREQEVGIERGTGFDVLVYFSLKSFLLTVLDYGSANLAAALQNSNYGGLVFGACPSNAATALRHVHIPSLAADESFIHLDMPR